MALKFNNPYAKTPAEVTAEQHAAAVDAYLKANPQNKVVTLNEIKTALPAIAGDLNRVVINIIMAKLGIEIVNPTDNDA